MASCGLKTVPEEALLPPSTTCTVCGAARERRTLLVLQESPRVTLDECAHCRAASASRFPTDQYLADYYNPANYSSSLVSNVTLSARWAASILKATDFSRDADLHVLDYGGSEGTLSQELRKQIMASGHRGEVQSTVVDIFRGKRPITSAS